MKKCKLIPEVIFIGKLINLLASVFFSSASNSVFNAFSKSLAAALKPSLKPLEMSALCLFLVMYRVVAQFLQFVQLLAYRILWQFLCCKIVIT